jgi:hypothetical protein
LKDFYKSQEYAELFAELEDVMESRDNELINDIIQDLQIAKKAYEDNQPEWYHLAQLNSVEPEVLEARGIFIDSLKYDCHAFDVEEFKRNVRKEDF